MIIRIILLRAFKIRILQLLLVIYIYDIHYSIFKLILHFLSYSSGKYESCYRCFRMKVRSYNILQLHTKTLEKCFIKEEMARESCPSDTQLNDKHLKELILFRK